MPVVTNLAPYSDDQGNTIVVPEAIAGDVRINFRGSGNRLVVALPVRLGRLTIDFDCNNGEVQVRPSKGVPPFSAAIRVGEDSKVLIGRNVSCTTTVAISATEGTTVRIGEDVMFASENQVRADDGHPIFDIYSGQRVNVSKSITIGNHVWLGRGAVLLGGARVGDGTVVGYGSIVTGRIPNNCVAAGVPARVLRRNVAWERPHLSLVKPYYKPDATTIEKSKYWKPTDEGTPPTLTVRLRRRLGRVPLVQRLRALVRR